MPGPCLPRFIGLVLLVASGFAAAEPLGAAPPPPDPLPAYESQRVRSFLATPWDRSRMRATLVDTRRLDACIAAVRLHAGNPVLRFRSEEEQAAARRDALAMAIPLADVDPRATGRGIVLRAAVLLSLAQNLGAPAEAGELAEARFRFLLDREPADPETLFEYGVFLVNRGRPAEALPVLEAATGREPRARWPLAVAYLALGRAANAREQLDALKAGPRSVSGAYPLDSAYASLP